MAIMKYVPVQYCFHLWYKNDTRKSARYDIVLCLRGVSLQFSITDLYQLKEMRFT